MKLIDKDAVVAEITKIYDINRSNGYIDVCDEIDNILSFIDTLEVKEVDLEKEVRKFIKDNGTSLEEPDEFLTTLMQLDDMVMFAKHFYELGLSAQTSTVWHYVSKEIPTKFGNPIIVASKNKNKKDGIWIYDLIQSWEGEWSPRVNWENPVKWAYMDDLLK